MSDEHVQSVSVEGSGKSWHGWETPMTLEESQNLDHVMKACGLENVRSVPLIGLSVDEETSEVSHLPTGQIGLYDSRNLCLGVHGADSYQIHQPRDILEPFWERIQLLEGFRFDFMARLREGKVFVANFALEGGMNVVTEKHDFYISVSSSFDGTRATTAGASSVRQVCMNTVKMFDMSDSTVKTRFRHKRALPQGDSIMLQLEHALKQRDMYIAFGDKLAGVRMGKDDAMQFLRDSICPPKTEKVQTVTGDFVEVVSQPSTRQNNRMEKMEKAFEITLNETGNELTAWTVWNSITRFADHETGIKRTEAREGLNDNQIRYENNLFGNSAAFKDAQRERLLQLIAA